MKRVYVYTDKSQENGRLMILDTSETKRFLFNMSVLFNIPLETLKLFAANGCEINDVRAIRDDEEIYMTSDVPEESGTNVKSVSKSEEEAVPDWITLNVGGKHFTTSRVTLVSKEPTSMLARMFADDNEDKGSSMKPSATDSTGAYLIDRSPEYFEPILNYLRHGEVILDRHVNPKGVLQEAMFYGIDSMLPILNPMIENQEKRESCMGRGRFRGGEMIHRGDSKCGQKGDSQMTRLRNAQAGLRIHHNI